MARYVAVLVVAVCLTLFLPLVGHSFEIEGPGVVDTVGGLPADRLPWITRQLRWLEEQTGVRMAVVVVGSTGQQSMEAYARQIAIGWEGSHREQENWVLLVLAVAEGTMGLEVGDGLNPVFSYVEATEVLLRASSYLQERDYGRATLVIINGVREHTAHLEPGKPIRRSRAGYAKLLMILIFLLAVTKGYLWQRSRDGLFVEEPRWKEQAKEADELSDEELENLKFSAVNVRAVDVLWWTAPLLFVGALFHVQGYWLPFGLLWYGAAICSALSAGVFPRKIYALILGGLAIPYVVAPLKVLSSPTSAEVLEFMLVATAVTVAVTAAGAVMGLFYFFASENHDQSLDGEGRGGGARPWQQYHAAQEKFAEPAPVEEESGARNGPDGNGADGDDGFVEPPVDGAANW